MDVVVVGRADDVELGVLDCVGAELAVVHVAETLELVADSVQVLVVVERHHRDVDDLLGRQPGAGLGLREGVGHGHPRRQAAGEGQAAVGSAEAAHRGHLHEGRHHELQVEGVRHHVEVGWRRDFFAESRCGLLFLLDVADVHGFELLFSLGVRN